MRIKNIFRGATLLFTASLLLASCDLNDDDSWTKEMETSAYIAVGTIKKESGKFYFLEDDQNSIYPRNFQAIADSLVGKRIWFKFYKYKEAYKEPNFDETAYINQIGRNLLTKPFFKVVTQNQSDSLGNDPVGILVAWVTGEYVNVEFTYSGMGSKPHYINLAQNMLNKGKTTSDTLSLEFRHNGRGEQPYQYFQGVASFNISAIYPEKGGKLKITYQPYNTSERSFYLNLPSLQRPIAAVASSGE